MIRSITNRVLQDLEDKMVFITGPRQVGKTTLAKSLVPNYDYLNYDAKEHRIILQENSWDRSKPLIIFDELHKMEKWKGWLKGIYDTEGISPRILVTGSAKLNTYRKVGDSLAGRYFSYRLHPFDLKEIKDHYAQDEAFDLLWNCSGFPEPFLKGNATYYNRWRRSHLDIILRQDLIDTHNVRDIQGIETLVVLLQRGIGSTVSYSNLARTLERDAKTIKRWLLLLEELYVVFKVTPFSNKIERSLLKEPKYYFYDFVRANHDKGVKLENIVACALLKELHFLEDIYGMDTKLHFLRTKDGKEIDFLVLINDEVKYIIEVKWSDDNPSKHFNYFARNFPQAKQIQLVKELKREKTFPSGVEIRSLIPWLYNLELA